MKPHVSLDGWMPYLAIATGNTGRFGIGGVIELAAVGVMMILA